VLLPGPGTGHPAGGQRLAAQGRHRVSGVRGAVRRRRRRRQVQAAVGRAAHRAVSPGTARVRRHGHRGRDGRGRDLRRRGAPDLDVNETVCPARLTFLRSLPRFLVRATSRTRVCIVIICVTRRLT